MFPMNFGNSSRCGVRLGARPISPVLPVRCSPLKPAAAIPRRPLWIAEKHERIASRRLMFFWKSAPLGVLNNCQSKIHRSAHKSNERRTTTSTAHPTGHRSPATIAVDVSITSVWRTVPAPVFASRARLFQLPSHNPFDLNLGFVLAGLCQVIGHLQPQPRFRTTAERLVETDRHLRRNTRLAVHKVVERLPFHTKNFCRLGDRQTKRFDTVMPDGKPRMGRVFHPHGLAPHSSDTRLDQRHLCFPHQSEI